MKLVLPLLATAALLSASACGNRPEPSASAKPAAIAPAPAPAEPATATPAPPADAAPSPAPAAGAPGADRVEDTLPTAPPNSSKTHPVDRKLTEALQRYNEATGRMPPSFNALVAGKYLPALPPLPPGKRHAIDRPNMQVVIID